MTSFICRLMKISQESKKKQLMTQIDLASNRQYKPVSVVMQADTYYALYFACRFVEAPCEVVVRIDGEYIIKLRMQKGRASLLRQPFVFNPLYFSGARPMVITVEFRAHFDDLPQIGSDIDLHNGELLVPSLLCVNPGVPSQQFVKCCSPVSFVNNLSKVTFIVSTEPLTSRFKLPDSINPTTWLPYGTHSEPSQHTSYCPTCSFLAPCKSDAWWDHIHSPHHHRKLFMRMLCSALAKQRLNISALSNCFERDSAAIITLDYDLLFCEACYYWGSKLQMFTHLQCVQHAIKAQTPQADRKPFWSLPCDIDCSCYAL